MEEPSWETSLDVDDSDLPSLLRPCKQKRLYHHHHHHHHHISQTTTSAAPSQSQSQHPILIPGPAGPVQSAMLRKIRDREIHNSNPIPTQEYIRKAVENSSPEFDHDFQANPWLSALQFLGVVDGVIPTTPLSSIKKWANVGKVDKVVAVIKSCTPNGLGGLMVTLKDPTGTVGASIHHKVLSESEFGKDLSLGSVLILQKVAVFTPSQSAYYLNIALRNLVKVFSKRNGPPSEQNCPANSIRYSTPNIDYCGKASRLDNASTMGRETSKQILEDMRRYTDKRHDSQAEKENLLSGSKECRNEVSLNHIAVVETQALTSRQEAAKDIFEETVADENSDYSKGFMDEKCKPLKEGNLQSSLLGSSAATNSIANNTDEETLRANKVQKQTQPLISRTSLPQWTEEQLNELFASDGEDDGTMF